jgi:sugar O-acyltransferase (sialic acid O-acetyltransferase NeuD family)
MNRKLVILGDSAFAEVAYEYFSRDSEYEVVAFSVEGEYLRRKELLGLPVFPFEELVDKASPEEHDVYAALVYTQLNRLRRRMADAAKEQSYGLASYISSKAFVWPNVELGEHCFVFENNVVQPFVKIGSNVVLWSGNHIGHHSTIGDNCFVSSHVVVSGFCSIGENSFMGVNSCVGDRVAVANDCLIGAGAVIVKDTEPGLVYVGNPAKPTGRDSFSVFGVPAGAR